MFRLSWPERCALRALSAALPQGAVASLYGSRTDPTAKGGDVDVLVEYDADEAERFKVAIAASLAYSAVCEAKVDVTVVLRNGRTPEQREFVNPLSLIPVAFVLESPFLHHVAFLVRHLETPLAQLALLGFPMSTPKEFQSEGTREAYVGEEGRPARILLVQPIAEGPYARALAKRGCGLHHIGFSTPDLGVVAERVRGGGWIEHAHAAGREDLSARWYFKPGINTLVEIFEGAPPPPVPLQPVAESLEVAVNGMHLADATDWLFSMTPALTAADKTRLRCAGRWIEDTETFS